MYTRMREARIPAFSQCFPACVCTIEGEREGNIYDISYISDEDDESLSSAFVYSQRLMIDGISRVINEKEANEIFLPPLNERGVKTCTRAHRNEMHFEPKRKFDSS